MVTEKKKKPKLPLTTKEQNLLTLVDTHEEEITQLLQELVQIESLNFSEFQFWDNSAIFKFTKEFLDEEGFATELFKAPFTSGKKDEFYYNLIATLDSSSKGKTLQFNGHLDIVPYNEENWDSDTPPLGGVIKDGKLYGCGSFDMKAGIACQIMAMKLLKESGEKFSGKLQMWFTPDEETHGIYGSAFMSKNNLERVNADATIISEPSIRHPLTSPYIGIGEKGPHWLKFTFHGVAGHGSWPKEKSNAINKATNFMVNARKKLKFPKQKPPITKWQSMRQLISRVGLAGFREMRAFTPEKMPLDKDKKDSGILYRTTFSFNEIKAGIKTNIIPDRCEIDVDFRTMPGLKSQQLFDSLVKYCSKLKYRIELPEGYTNLQHNDPKFKDKPIDVYLSILTIGEGSATSPNSEFGKVIHNAFTTVYKTSPIFSYGTGFSDAGNMREAGMKDIFVFGPGGRNAHNANEYANLSTLKDITKLYLLIAYRYLNS